MQGELSVGTVASFIGYTFTLTFAVSSFPALLFFCSHLLHGVQILCFQVQGLVNTFGDLRGAFAATERINTVLSGVEVDEALAYGLRKDIKQKDGLDKNFDMFFVSDSDGDNRSKNIGYMSSLKGDSNVRSLAGCGDIYLEGIFS